MTYLSRSNFSAGFTPTQVGYKDVRNLKIFFKEEPEWDWKDAKIKYHYACILQLIANALVLINSTVGVFAVTGISQDVLTNDLG